MALQQCPKCSSESFTWFIDDEISDLTNWSCGQCGYFAQEDEKNERVCHRCNAKTESLLSDQDDTYYWCSKCNSIRERTSSIF